MRKDEQPVCPWHHDCGANKDGRCVALTDTKFPGKNDCPFYKTKEQFDKEDAAVVEKLLAEGKEELLIYYRGKNYGRKHKKR